MALFFLTSDELGSEEQFIGIYALEPSVAHGQGHAAARVDQCFESLKLKLSSRPNLIG